ncbi:MAG TPA: TrkA family potassium uptake protein, partial [Firmicutes bacterium]|nr:TrkA family potassium uptake protein [Bacillota bacterium]
MYVIIVGCGNIGASLAKIMQEEHNVVIIDKKSENFSKLGRGFNGISIEGNGLDLEVLKEAGIEKADAVIATTGHDNTNIALAQISKKIFNVPKAIARISDPEKAEVYRMLGVDLISSTSLIAALIRDKIIEKRFSTYILENSKLTT